MKKTLISFVATYANQLGELMMDDSALLFVYNEYKYCVQLNGSDEEFSITNAIQQWIVSTNANAMVF